MSEFPRYRITLPFTILGFFWATAVVALAAPISAQLTRTETQNLQREARFVVDLLQNHHYAGKAFRELDSATMINRFLDELDPRAEFLDASDAGHFHRRFDRTLKSVYLFRGDLQPAFEIFDRFASRASDRLAWVQARLDRGFDFAVDESFTPRKDGTPFATQAEADRHWELQLKTDVLNERLLGREPDAATAEVKRRYERVRRIIAAYDPLAVRERFFDAIIRSYDPHSGYFSSDSAREFAMEMEKAVVGLGIELRKEDGQCVVTAVQAGGPADLASGLDAGDILEALAEGDDGAWVDLTGLRLREIVGLLRGKTGSKLRIAYRHPGQPERIEQTVERNRVEFAGDRARGATYTVPGIAGTSRQIGWIQLPSFYAAGEGSMLSSAARDVRELLEQMKPESLDGLVLDLRGNPGGALTEAVALSEIFLPRGVIMLSRGAGGKVKEHAIKEGPPLYPGPLVVLTSFNSASASEVFSGAMRYHRRAVIAGAPATFGKGSVQAYIELAKMAPEGAKDWGTLRVTTEKFFQPDGSSVQVTGVAAHVPFPELTLREEMTREADLPGRLPAESIAAPANLTPAGEPDALSDALVEHLRQRVATDATQLPEWQLRRDEHELWQKDTAEKTWSLVEASRQEDWISRQAAWHALALRRRALTAQESYPGKPFEVAAARKLIASEDARLRAAADNPAKSIFVVTTDQGHQRRLNLAEIHFARFAGDAAALAAKTGKAHEPAWPADRIESFLRLTDLLRYKTPNNVTALAREVFPPDDDPARFNRRLAELLQQIAALDGESLRERPGLDIELRESLRLAAAWADWPPIAPAQP